MTNTNVKIAPQPKIGEGATMVIGSDCYPYTIVEISKSGKRIGIQRDDWKRIDNNGYGEQQEYEYTQNPMAPVEKVSLRKNGYWRTVRGGTYVSIGTRRKYEDPSF